jgi:hypothetical protein
VERYKKKRSHNSDFMMEGIQVPLPLLVPLAFSKLGGQSSTPILYYGVISSTKIWFGGDSEISFANSIYARHRYEKRTPSFVPNALPLPHPYKRSSNHGF